VFIKFAYVRYVKGNDLFYRRLPAIW